MHYSEGVWCDVLPMTATHILLGRPWLYDQDVSSFGRSNTHTFMHKGKKIVLTPRQLKPQVESHSTGTLTKQSKGKSLHLVGKNEFIKESQEEGLIYMVIGLSESPGNQEDYPPKVHRVISDF